MRTIDNESVLFADSLSCEIERVVADLAPDRVFLLTDTNVAKAVKVCLPPGVAVREVPAGESTKSVESACGLWRWLAESGATRRSLLLNLGGGVVSDLGGFVAATFKRGIRFVNLPTTLLAMADAAIGGKTGIDFMGLKNEVGAFACPERVVICADVLKTLPDAELRSGFAEVVKTAVISDAGVYDSLLRPGALYNTEIMARAIRFAARTKQEVVAQDPAERGLRRILNFGHTAGHAYEEYAAAIGSPVSHGEAVAHGMLTALRQSSDRLGFPAWRVDEYEKNILERYYRPLPFGYEAEPELRRLMTHDKKNVGDGKIRFVLLRDVGEPVW